MHTCVHCGGACYCHGDIDDCETETPEYADEHCTGCSCVDEPEDGIFITPEITEPPQTDADVRVALEAAGQIRLPL